MSELLCRMSWWCRLFHFREWRDESSFQRQIAQTGAPISVKVDTVTRIRCLTCRREYALACTIPGRA